MLMAERGDRDTQEDNTMRTIMIVGFVIVTLLLLQSTLGLLWTGVVLAHAGGDGSVLPWFLIALLTELVLIVTLRWLLRRLRPRDS